jgi:hypothetical protein
MTWTRRRFLDTAVLSAAVGLGARTPVVAQTPRPVTVSHSVSTFVYGQHLVAKEKYYKTIFDWDLVIDEKDYENGIKVWIPTAVDKPIAYGKAVNMSFVPKAQAKYRS